MSSARQAIISLAHELEAQQNEAYSLWTWLPSYKAAEAAHGDYASNHTPSVADVLKEACMFIAHGLNPSDEQRAEAGDFYKCPCGEVHDGAQRIVSTAAVRQSVGNAS